MPKIGKPVDDRPYVLRCTVCRCMPLRECHERFDPYTGRAVGKRYDCPVHAHWQLCSDENRDGCKPERVYGFHAYDDGAGGLWHHPGEKGDCPLPECKECAHPRGFTWADDGMGHSGAVCEECGAPEPETDPWANPPESTDHDADAPWNWPVS